MLDHRPASIDSQDRRMLFGLGLDPVTLDQAVDRCLMALDGDGRVLVGVLNAAKVVNLRGDAMLRDSLVDCDMLLADGQSVVWASRILRQPLPERVAGIDLFESLLDLAHRDGRSVFLLGAKPEVLHRLLEVIEERWPGLRIAGARDGYFTADQGAEVAAEILSTRPDMLFLGITSPKKEIFLATHGDALGVPVLHGVGGSFDVMAGITRRAPEAWQRAGMEWAFRLVQEPRRMWKRYLRTNTLFIGLVARERLRPTKPFAPSVPRSL